MNKSKDKLGNNRRNYGRFEANKASLDKQNNLNKHFEKNKGEPGQRRRQPLLQDFTKFIERWTAINNQDGSSVLPIKTTSKMQLEMSAVHSSKALVVSSFVTHNET